MTDDAKIGQIEFRLKILSEVFTDKKKLHKLLEYNRSISETPMIFINKIFPLEDEPFVCYWEKYIKQIKASGSFLSLNECLLELNFPVRKGISLEAKYLDAIKRGIIQNKEKDKPKVTLVAENKIKVFLYRTYAGRIPVISTCCRSDFSSIVSVFAGRNEPLEIPDSVGAYMISGYNNWERIWSLAADYRQATGKVITSEEFKKIKGDGSLYKDSFIIICTGFYSGINYLKTAFTEKEWLEKSFKIKIGHECAHYIFNRLFSSMGGRIIHELIADYIGIVSTMGKYDAKSAQLFLGIESYPKIEKTGRFSYYSEHLDEEFIPIQAGLLYKATLNLEKLNCFLISENDRETCFLILLLLSQFSLEEIVSDEFTGLFKQCFKAIASIIEFK